MLLHHTETVDPELVAWIRHLIEDVIGIEPWFLVIVVGAVIVAIPVTLMVSAIRRQRLGIKSEQSESSENS